MTQILAYPKSALTKENPDPEFLMIDSQPRQIWVKNDHYLRTENRRANPGKIYHFQEFNQLLRVVDILEAEESVTKAQVENGRDTLVVEYLYELNGHPSKEEFTQEYEIEGEKYTPGTEYAGDCDFVVEGQTGGIQRYQVESPEALSMGDRPPVSYERIINNSPEELRNQLQKGLDEF